MYTIAIDPVMILLAAVANMVLGMLWYSPAMFGKQWMRLVGMKKQQAKHQDIGFVYSLTFGAALLMAFVLAVFIENITGATAYTGAIVGFWAALGFVATTSLPEFLFHPHSKPKELYFINTGYHFVSLIIMGVILAI